jgi:hypothetical protein
MLKPNKLHIRFNCQLAIFAIALIINLDAVAHSGRTDSQGGHNDHINGEYHFHHGESPHQHPNGVCPYEEDGGSSSPIAELIIEFSIAVIFLTAIVVFVIDQGNQNSLSFKAYLIRRLIQVTVFVAIVQLIRSIF